MDNKNFIVAEINITEDYINKHIKIINSFEEIKREEEREDQNDDYKYENEKEIKEKCTIKIDCKIIPFSYYYQFNEKRKYKIEYLFSENLNNASYLFCDCNSLINFDLSNFNT